MAFSTPTFVAQRRELKTQAARPKAAKASPASLQTHPKNQARYDGSMTAYHSCPLARMLWNACAYGDPSEIAQALDEGADPNGRGLHGWTPLILSIIHGRDESLPHGRNEALRLLLARGADLDLADDGGATPAMRAAMHGRLDALRFLADRGADLDAIDRRGFSALDLAIQEERSECAQFLAALLASRKEREVLEGLPPASSKARARM